MTEPSREPTAQIAILLERVAQITLQTADLTAKIDRLAATMESTYVRKDLYEARHREVRDDVADLRAEKAPAVAVTTLTQQVASKAAASDVAVLTARVDKHAEWWVWAIRVAGASVIVAVVAALLALGGQR